VCPSYPPPTQRCDTYLLLLSELAALTADSVSGRGVMSKVVEELGRRVRMAVRMLQVRLA
jgi:hypothetical protein